MSELVSILGLGVVILSNDKKGYGFEFLDKDKKRTGEKIYFSSKIKNAPGLIYEIEMSTTEGERSFNGEPKLIGQYANEEVRAELFITSNANLTMLTAFTQRKKAENSKEDILSCLKPIRKAYLKTNSLGRMAIEVRVLNYIRHNSDLR